jgi:GTP-binding protein EngB required for normal cell division
VYLIDVATTDLKDDLAMLQELAREDLKIIICLTKIDEVEQAEEKAQNIAKSFNLKFLRMSCYKFRQRKIFIFRI